MMYVQSKMMPKSDDPQIQMQQKTMKFMMILMLFFFYKSPAGLRDLLHLFERLGHDRTEADSEEHRQLPEDRPSGGRLRRTTRKAKAGGAEGLAREEDGRLAREVGSRILEEAQKQQQLQREQRPAIRRRASSRRDSRTGERRKRSDRFVISRASVSARGTGGKTSRRSRVARSLPMPNATPIFACREAVRTGRCY